MVSETEESIFKFRKPPVLLIGSGISRRYVAGFPDWNGLLWIIAQRIGINEGVFIALRHQAKANRKKDIGEMPRLATELQIYFNNEIIKGNAEPKKIFNKDEYALFVNGIDPIKIMASSALKNLKLSDDVSLQEEIQILKKLVDVIPCVVTTNFDCLLEENIFDNKFCVFSKVSDYYFSKAQGIGEVFKIHGTVTNPGSIIINEEDYLELKDNSKIVSAKLLSTLCDYPMIIMGYSLDDTDVKDILNDLISSLDDEKLREIETNIIYISYTPGEKGFVKLTSNFAYKEKRLAITSIKTDNLKAIYQELSEMTPSTSPSKLRKIRQLVTQIVIGDKSTDSKYMTIGIDDITDENSDKLVVAITDKSIVKSLQEIPIIRTDNMVQDILSGNSNYDSDAIVVYFLNSKHLHKNEYVPIFHFLRDSKTDKGKDSKYLKKFIAAKKTQFAERMRTLRSLAIIRAKNVDSLDGVYDVMNSVRDDLKPLVIMYYYDQGVIAEPEALRLLRELDKKWKQSPPTSSRGLCDSYFKCAISYLAFKAMGFEK